MENTKENKTVIIDKITQILTRFSNSDDVSSVEYDNYKFAFDTLLSDLYEKEVDQKQGYNATIINYDVWGNERDGYDVNDKSTYGTFDFTDDDFDIDNDVDIIDFLQKHYFSMPVKLSDIEIDGDIECCYINEVKTGKPICEIIFNQIPSKIQENDIYDSGKCPKCKTNSTNYDGVDGDGDLSFVDYTCKKCNCEFREVFKYSETIIQD